VTGDDRSSIVVAGPPDGAPIVFVHGTGLSKTAWSPQLAGLADTYRVVALDLPGHGGSASQAFTLDTAAAEVARVIDAEAAGRAVLVGLSLGGYVAMETAAQRPDRVRGLVLVGASQEPVGLRALPYRALAIALAQVGRLDPNLVRRVARAVVELRYGRRIADQLIDGGVHPGGGAIALRAIVGRRYAPRLARYDGPVLLLNGELDVLFRSDAKRFADAARTARRVRLGGAGHLANLDRPAAFDVAIRRFVESLGYGS
jgi:pimeloyl-ACP methyl ester carboxylesterase